LKAPGVSIDEKGEQYRILQSLTGLGHPATWANSVYTFATMALSLGVPLQRNWQYVAQHEDELVAADIRKQEVRAEAKRSAAPALYKQPSRAPTPSRLRQWAKTQKALA
jgi:cobalamin biosynthesis protein CobD/CbiB